jgi:hypothetical protein
LEIDLQENHEDNLITEDSQDTQDFFLKQMLAYPIDWSLKGEAKFFSETPFEVI